MVYEPTYNWGGPPCMSDMKKKFLDPYQQLAKHSHPSVVISPSRWRNKIETPQHSICLNQENCIADASDQLAVVSRTQLGFQTIA